MLRTLATLVSCAHILQHPDLASKITWALEVVKCFARQQSIHSGSDRNLQACVISKLPLQRSNSALLAASNDPKLSEQPQ